MSVVLYNTTSFIYTPKKENENRNTTRFETTERKHKEWPMCAKTLLIAEPSITIPMVMVVNANTAEARVMP